MALQQCTVARKESGERKYIFNITPKVKVLLTKPGCSSQIYGLYVYKECFDITDMFGNNVSKCFTYTHTKNLERTENRVVVSLSVAGN